MLHLTANSKIILVINPVDFRKHIDGLAAICRTHFSLSPNDGTYYVFINRAKTAIKILCYKENGYWLSLKRLSLGKFKTWPKSKSDIDKVYAHNLRSILKNELA